MTKKPGAPPLMLTGRMIEHWVTSELLARGYNVAWPVVDDGTDLWVETAEGIRTIQVKTAKHAARRQRPNGKGWQKERWLLSTYGTTKRRLEDYRVDAFVAVSKDRTKCWVVDRARVQGRGTGWRLRPPDLNAWDRIGTPRLAPVAVVSDPPQLTLVTER